MKQANVDGSSGPDLNGQLDHKKLSSNNLSLMHTNTMPLNDQAPIGTAT